MVAGMPLEAKEGGVRSGREARSRHRGPPPLACLFVLLSLLDRTSHAFSARQVDAPGAGTSHTLPIFWYSRRATRMRCFMPIFPPLPAAR